jgi:hypothetical protein
MPRCRRLVARGIHPIFSNSVELVFSEKTAAFLAILPSSLMFLIIMEMANAVVFMLELAITSAAVGEVGRVATYPLVATGSFHQWCAVIAAKATDLTGNRLRFHPIICHRRLSFLHRCVFTGMRLLPGHFICVQGDCSIAAPPIARSVSRRIPAIPWH